jgi:K+-sensing histidine kinase KdpD
LRSSKLFFKKWFNLTLITIIKADSLSLIRLHVIMLMFLSFVIWDVGRWYMLFLFRILILIFTHKFNGVVTVTYLVTSRLRYVFYLLCRRWFLSVNDFKCLITLFATLFSSMLAMWTHAITEILKWTVSWVSVSKRIMFGIFHEWWICTF